MKYLSWLITTELQVSNEQSMLFLLTILAESTNGYLKITAGQLFIFTLTKNMTDPTAFGGL